MRRLSFVLACSLVLAVCGAAVCGDAVFGAAFAQQQKQPPRKPAPRLTTEDVIGERAAQKTVEVSDDAAKAEGDARAAIVGASPADGQVSPDEAAWRENVAKARERAKQTEREAEESELRTTEARNQLNSTNQTTQERNDAAAALESAGAALVEARREAATAKQDLEKLLEYGREKRFTEAAEKQPAEGDEKGNEEHFRKRHTDLLEKLDQAARRVQLYENRISEVNRRMQNNSGSGDNFFLSQLQQERDDAQAKLDEAQAAYQKAQQDTDDLKREARKAGVAPGVFR
jgi:DNA repair exonuclease SbcCD ATPase subunit